MMGKQLEPWEGYRGPPVPEGTDATQIPVLKRASNEGITTLALIM